MNVYPHMRKVVVSLFNRLDPKGEGIVTFEDLVCSFYPALKGDARLKSMVDEWIDQIYQAEQLFERKDRSKVDFKGSLTLLIDDPERIRASFFTNDVDQKGFLTINNIMKATGATGSNSESMLREKFNQFSVGGKLHLHGFGRLLAALSKEKDSGGYLTLLLRETKKDI